MDQPGIELLQGVAGKAQAVQHAGTIGVHQHVGNTETYHILSGHALYNDNGKEVEIGAGTTTFCPDGETHGIKNTSKTEDLVFMALIIRK